MSRRSRKSPPGSGDVGYGQTPEWTRFRKGQSGNPKGRPRKERACEPVLPEDNPAKVIQRRVLGHKVRVKVDGKVCELTREEAIFLAMSNSALKGNGPSQRELMKIADKLGQWEAARAALERQMVTESFEETLEWQKNMRLLWEARERSGQDTGDLWPHPDDILINEETMSYRVRGPRSDRDVPFYERLRTMRDFYLCRGVLDLRGKKVNRKAWFEFNTMIWMGYDGMLPLRWQLGEQALAVVSCLLAMPIRDLRQYHGEVSDRADKTSGAALSDPTPKESYALTNAVMKPLLRHHGYRSLAELERAIEDSDGNPPWPKLPGPV